MLDFFECGEIHSSRLVDSCESSEVADLIDIVGTGEDGDEEAIVFHRVATLSNFVRSNDRCDLVQFRPFLRNVGSES